MKSTLIKLGGVAIVLALASVLQTRTSATPPAAPVPVTEKGSVRQIKLPEVEATLPPGPGREAVIAHCGTCHTQTYILLQPNFPRTTWEAEVTKMRTTFSGPIPEQSVKEIVDYLTSIRGAAAAK